MEIFKPKQDIETRRNPDRATEGDRRRGGWRDFRRAYPGFVFVLGLGLGLMVAVDAWLIYKRVDYTNEVSSLRSRMTEAERARTDAIVQTEENKLRLAIELIKRQSKFDKKLHLNVSLDSAKMYLTREGAVLREMAVQFGPETPPSATDSAPPVALPRGERTVQDLSDSRIALDGGATILVASSSTVSNDSTPIPPGSLRIGSEDMKAIMPNLKAGMKVYFY